MSITPPFIGTKTISDIPFHEIDKLIDRELLFASTWKFRQNSTAEEWEVMKRTTVEPIYSRLISMCQSKSILIPKAIYGYFHCKKMGNGLLVSGTRREQRFNFPRERETPNRCLADFFGDGIIAIQAVTVGDGVSREAAASFAKNSYSDAFFLRGLAAVVAETTAVYCHRLISSELGIEFNPHGRFSAGYPSFPDLLEQRKIFVLLEPASIGLNLSKTCHLMPEHSTTAIISPDPKAQQFRP